jgi:putative NADH-flavin reductase
MKLCVIGATGGTGIEFIKLALERGHTVTALVRDGKHLPAPLVRAQVVNGDALDPKPVSLAVQGCDAVVCALGARLGQPPGTTRSGGTQVLVDAMRRSGAKRLIAVSAVGATGSRANQSLASRWILPMLIGKPRLVEVDLQEDIVARSNLDWTLVRAPRLVDGAASGQVRAEVGLATNMSSQLRRADLAAFLLDEAERPKFVRLTPTVVSLKS